MLSQTAQAIIDAYHAARAAAAATPRTGLRDMVEVYLPLRGIVLTLNEANRHYPREPYALLPPRRSLRKGVNQALRKAISRLRHRKAPS